MFSEEQAAFMDPTEVANAEAFYAGLPTPQMRNEDTGFPMFGDGLDDMRRALNRFISQEGYEEGMEKLFHKASAMLNKCSE